VLARVGEHRVGHLVAGRGGGALARGRDAQRPDRALQPDELGDLLADGPHAGDAVELGDPLRGAEPEETWERLKVFKLIRDLAASEYSGYWNTEIIHGSGSPAAEILAMYRETDLGACERLVERAHSGREAILPPAGAAA
jgi:hypothetical protein